MSTDQPIGQPRPRAALLILAARRTSGHGPVTAATATARISSDLWPDLVAWLQPPAQARIVAVAAGDLEFAGYRCIEDASLPPDTVRLEK